MSQVIQHYQTSFVVVNDSQEGDNKLYQAQHLIGEWIKAHENKRFRAMRRDKRASFLLDGNFRRRASYSSQYSWCKTNYCVMEDSLAWAVEYTHRDSNIRDVFWVSEIGLRCFNDSRNLIVSVRISYKISTEFALMGSKFSPDVSIPWCVSGLLETFDGSRFYSGDQDVTAGIKNAVTISDEEKAKEVLAYIESRNRKLAVVLLSGESKDVLSEADFLSKNLFAKALVFVIPYKQEIRRVFARLKIEFNECVFIPPFVVFNKNLEGKLRYFTTDKTTALSRHNAILRGWLGFHPVNESGGVQDVANVQLLIRRQMYARLEEVLKGCVPAADYERVKEELKDMSGLFDLSEAEKQELKDRVGELENRTLTLEIEKESLADEHATQIHNLKTTQEMMSLRSVEYNEVLPRAYPNTFEALKSFAPFYKHLAFAESAWEPAIAYRQFRDFEIAWQMLHDLDQKLWGIVFETRGDIEREFNSSSNFRYARGEGQQTANNARLSQLRKFSFEGKEYEMWTHLKYGNRPGKQLRIYFAIDNEKRRFIVGYIGDHMDNATTRNVK